MPVVLTVAMQRCHHHPKEGFSVDEKRSRDVARSVIRDREQIDGARVADDAPDKAREHIAATPASGNRNRILYSQSTFLDQTQLWCPRCLASLTAHPLSRGTTGIFSDLCRDDRTQTPFFAQGGICSKRSPRPGFLPIGLTIGADFTATPR